MTPSSKNLQTLHVPATKTARSLATQTAWPTALACIFAASCLLLSGCKKETKLPPQVKKSRSSTATANATIDALRTAIDLLDSTEFDPTQSLTQSGNRIHQWLSTQQPDSTWKPDPLLSSLPENFQRNVAGKRYDDLDFHLLIDGAYLRENIWLRKVSTGLLDGQPTDLELANRMFDWVVRNIQLEPKNPSGSASRFAWKSLLTGRGTSIDRAWLMMLLARQQGLDVVFLAEPQETGAPTPLVLGVVIDSEIYLFDPELGLAIPGPGGEGVATLRQVQGDDSLLRQLDLPEAAYPLKSEQFQQAVALLEASPFALSRRMQLVEQQLGSEQRVILTAYPSEQAERVAQAGVAVSQLWPAPYNTMVQEIARFETHQTDINEVVLARLMLPTPLRRGRLLHLAAEYDGEEGAKKYYMDSRMAEAEIETAAEIARLNADQIQALTNTKYDASYWMGLVTFEEGDYQAAADHLKKRSLDVAPDGPWHTGARYNLARSYEQLGRGDEAVALYRADNSPQKHGNLLRAQWLEDGKIKLPEPDPR